MGRYNGEDYPDQSGNVSQALQDAYRWAPYCGRYVERDGKFFGRCVLSSTHRMVTDAAPCLGSQEKTAATTWGKTRP